MKIIYLQSALQQEEPRRLQCGVYLAKISAVPKISTQNKNFEDGVTMKCQNTQCMIVCII